MIIYNNKEYRNLEEQVLDNKQKLEDLTDANTLGIHVIGHVDDAADLPDPTTYPGDYGDAYTVGTEAPYAIYVFTRPYSGYANPHWFNLGAIMIQGPQGEQGDTGPAGPQGTRGSIWKSGTTNPQVLGTEISGDVYLNVLTGNIYIYVSAYGWTFAGSIIGPQGIQGIQGEQGIQGPQGIQGVQGPQGLPASVVVIRGIVATTAQLPDVGDVERSDGYLVGTPGAYDIYIVTGADNSPYWTNAGPFDITDQIKVDALDQILTATWPIIETNTGSAINLSLDSSSFQDEAYCHRVVVRASDTDDRWINFNFWWIDLDDTPVSTSLGLFNSILSWYQDVNGANYNPGVYMSIGGRALWPGTPSDVFLFNYAYFSDASTIQVIPMMNANMDGDLQGKPQERVNNPVPLLDSSGNVYLMNSSYVASSVTIHDCVQSMNNILGLGAQVVANPVLGGTEPDLTGLEVRGTKYAIPTGTAVTANPVLGGTEPDLTGLDVGGTKYAIPTGTTVTANPVLGGTEPDLTGLDVGGTKYAIPVGTTVTANPVLGGTEPDLTGIEIGGTKYSVPAGGGGGSFREEGFTLQQIDQGIYSGEFDMYVLGNYEGTYGWHRATANTGYTYIDGVDTGVYEFTMTNVLLVFVKILGGNDYDGQTGTLYNCMGTVTTLESAINQLLVLGSNVTFTFLD